MRATKMRPTRAYSQAVYAELQKRGQAPKQALHTIRQYYRPLHQTWGLDLNPEAFADEMLKLQQISTKPIGKTVSIRPHFRKHRGQSVFVFGHSREKSTN